MQENPVQGHQKSMPTLSEEKKLFREKHIVLPHPSSFFPHPPNTGTLTHSTEMGTFNLFLFLSD